jgi:Protein of unknown function (DUF4236)
MGLRFRRRIRLAPGIRMNLSGSGVSWSFGPRGASLSVGRRGTFTNTGIPGTGLYSREKVSGSRRKTPEPVRTVDMTIRVSVDDDGVVSFTDTNGVPLPQELISQVKKQGAEEIRGLIAQKVEEINDSVDALGKVHLFTPPPVAPRYAMQPFKHEKPEEPVPRPLGFWGRLIRSRRERMESENAASQEDYERRLAAWERAKALHGQLEGHRKRLFEDDVRHSLEAIERVLEESFEDIPWPRETNISFDIRDSGQIVVLDVDLPEIEDMPTKVASATGRGFEVKFSDASATKTRQLYMHHVHGVGFRLVGEVFARLPLCDRVTLSAYSQRHNKQTGHLEDQYLYSVRVSRLDWSKIDFDNLERLEITAAFERFELRRKMTKTGVFQPIDAMS